MKTALGPERYGDSLEALLIFSSFPIISANIYKANSFYLGSDDIIAPWIIKKIKELEEEKRKRQEYEQPRVYIEDYPYEPIPKKDDKDDPDRGVVIINIREPDKE